jgi:hypothetical protein
VKLIPEKFNYTGGLMIFGDKVALFSFAKELMVVVTENKELAQIQKAMFTLIWDSLE